MTTFPLQDTPVNLEHGISARGLGEGLPGPLKCESRYAEGVSGELWLVEIKQVLIVSLNFAVS